MYSDNMTVVTMWRAIAPPLCTELAMKQTYTIIDQAHDEFD